MTPPSQSSIFTAIPTENVTFYTYKAKPPNFYDDLGKILVLYSGKYIMHKKYIWFQFRLMYPGSYRCIHVVTSHFCPKHTKVYSFTHPELSVLVYGANHMVAKSNSINELCNSQQSIAVTKHIFDCDLQTGYTQVFKVHYENNLPKKSYSPSKTLPSFILT